MTGSFSSFSQVWSCRLMAMTMTFSIHESIDPNGAYDMTFNSHPAVGASQDEFPILREKLRIPDIDTFIARPRITNLIRRSQSQFPATLISGRSGTGKTAIAATFAAENNSVAWYTVESNDVDWQIFSRYFSSSMQRAGCFQNALLSRNSERAPSQNEIAAFLAWLFCSPDASPDGDKSLIVLDDIHHLFDADWFGDFFNLLLYSLPTESHLLLLCRSRPPSPLWRLRSKQMLNVLDEKVIAFDIPETQALFRSLGVPASHAERAQRDSFGRAARLVQSA
jgi:ATP/maltotriose-dependent transcriptional regulator MalT